MQRIIVMQEIPIALDLLTQFAIRGKSRFSTTGSPAEEKEEERALDDLTNLDVEARWSERTDVRNPVNIVISRFGNIDEVVSSRFQKDVKEYFMQLKNQAFACSPISCLASIWLLRRRQSRSSL